MQIDQGKLNRKDAPALAFHLTPGRMPTVVFLTGFRSDMTGAKALHLEQHCARHGRAFLRFDYRGHGASGGRFEEGCVGDWRDDALAMLDEVVRGAGGPGRLQHGRLDHAARGIGAARASARPGRPGIRARFHARPDRRAPDARRSSPARAGRHAPGARRTMASRSRSPGACWRTASATSCSTGRSRSAARSIFCTARWTPTCRGRPRCGLAACLESAAVTVELIKDGDHRLSRDEDLRRIAAAVDRVLEQAGGDG